MPTGDPTPTPGAQAAVEFPTFTPPAPTASPTHAYTPTPGSESFNSEAKRALFNGDWHSSRLGFEQELQAESDIDDQANALLGIARTYALEGDASNSLQTIRQLTTEYAGSSSEAEAYFAMGQVLDSLERYGEAAQAYQQYLQLRPGIIDPYVYERIGDSLQNTGDMAGALEAYNASLAGQPTMGGEPIQIKIAQLYAAMEEYATAIDRYQAILINTDSDFTKSQMEYLTGIGYRLLDQPEESIAALQRAVDNYPRTYSAYLSLVELVELGVPVNELDRGVIDYHAGQYGVAVAALDRYLAEENVTGQSTALLYKGLALRDLGNYEGALAAWDELSANYPGSPEHAEALADAAFTLWAYLDRYPEGAQVLIDFVADYPDHRLAAEFLFDAARILERNLDLKQAATLWEETAVSYPLSELAFRSMFLYAITQYRLEDYSGARIAFERALGLAKTPAEVAASNLWIGKSEEILGEPVAARAAWERASIADPTGYYSERARDLLLERTAFEPPNGFDTGIDWEKERKEAEGWMRDTFNLPESIDFTGPGGLSSDPRFVRGTELWKLGLLEEARLEFEDLRKAVSWSPESQYRLANYFLDLGLYRSAIYSARTVLDLAGLDDAGTLNAPRYFNYIRFGTYYSDLVSFAAEEYGIHPLFLYSVMRQESLFEGFIRSSAGARGLMQIIPSTGQYIHDLVGWPPDYTADDLYRPNVSIFFGADHLDELRTRFDGDLYATLAGYNAGPGNSGIWHDLAGGDLDLFVEIVRFNETQNYIRGIYEIYTIYRMLYDRVNPI